MDSDTVRKDMLLVIRVCDGEELPAPPLEIMISMKRLSPFFLVNFSVEVKDETREQNIDQTFGLNRRVSIELVL